MSLTEPARSHTVAHNNEAEVDDDTCKKVCGRRPKERTGDLLGYTVI